MGLFDYVHVTDDRFVCSEGHPLSGEEFQTKDLGCTMGDSHIDRGRLHLNSGNYGEDPSIPFNGTIDVYCTCTKCPAFVQYGTGNLCPSGASFDVEIVGGVVVSVSRTSPSTEEFLASEPLRPYMKDCEGPMPYETAMRRHIFYPEDIRDAHKEKMRREFAERKASRR